MEQHVARTDGQHLYRTDGVPNVTAICGLTLTNNPLYNNQYMVYAKLFFWEARYVLRQLYNKAN